MARIVLDDVHKRYANGFVAAHGVSLDIADGELLVLVGPSGSGKSTLLRMIAGLEPVTAGRIRIGERDVTDLPPQQRDVAMVFQSYALYPHMTVRDNLAFGLSVRGTAASIIRARVDAAAESLGLAPLLDRKPAQLSGGQRQRVALGRAIVREPLAFLFDEPLSNLDARLRVETRAELARLHERLGATMVYVTHDQVEAMTLGTRVAVMHEGRLQQVAPPMELYRAPANRFVAGFIGSPSMNFVDGVIRARHAERVFEGAGITIALDGRDELADARPVTLGVRPQAVAIAPVHSASDGRSTSVPSTSDSTRDSPAPGRTGELPVGRVWLVELLGSEQIVHLVLGEIEDFHIVVSANHVVRRGDELSLSIAPSAIHFFDASTGASL